MRSYFWIAMAVGLLWGNPHSVTAQEAGKPAGEHTPKEGSQATELDGHLAHCLAIDNSLEIEIAKMAAGKLHRPELKQLAQTLQDDHHKLLTQLKKWCPSADQLSFADGGPRGETGQAGAEKHTSEAKKVGSTAGANTAADRGPEPHHPVTAANNPMMQIKEEIAHACVKSFKQEIDSKDSADVDRCFAGYEVAAHMRMLDTLRVFERHASPKLAEVISQAAQMTTQHLQQAKGLLTDIEATVARTTRPTETNVK